MLECPRIDCLFLHQWHQGSLLFFPIVFSVNSTTSDVTGKSLSEVLIFASTNPQYDNILFIELQVQYIKIPSSEHGENMLCTKVALYTTCFPKV